jgi:hypothetical protein
MQVRHEFTEPGAIVLDHYREIESAALVMLQAAHDDDWHRVTRIERAIRELAGRLDDLAPHHRLDAGQRRERRLIVGRLLSIDADVRRLAHPSNRTLDTIFAPRPAGGRRCGSA